MSNTNQFHTYYGRTTSCTVKRYSTFTIDLAINLCKPQNQMNKKLDKTSVVQLAFKCVG